MPRLPLTDQCSATVARVKRETWEHVTIPHAFSSSDVQFAAAVPYTLQQVGKAGIVLKPEQLQTFLLDRKLDSDSSVGTVVSPLVSLMVDQVPSLRSHGMSAAIMSVHTGVDKELLATERDVEAGNFRLLFCTPEAIIGSEKWRKLLLRPPLSERDVSVAIDEAHCVSKW